MKAALALFLACLATFGFAQDSTQESRAERLARWTEALELNLEAQLVREVRGDSPSAATLKTDGALLALYARALARTGEAAEARRLLEAAEPSPATRSRVELALARLDLEQDALDAVVSRLTDREADQPLRYPDEADSWLLLGKALQRQGDSSAARPLLARFVERWRLHPEAPAAWHLLARGALAARQLDEARRCREQGQNLATWHAYHKARRLQIRAKPEDPLPRYGLAQLWSSVGELERALNALAPCFELDPDFARAWALKGELQRKLGDPAKATASFDRALELDAKLHDARFNRALLAIVRGDDTAAYFDLERLVQGEPGADPRYLGAHLAMARVLRRMDREADAQQSYARYRELGGEEEL